MKAIAQLKTFEAACKVEGLDPKKVLPDFSGYPKKDRKAMRDVHISCLLGEAPAGAEGVHA